MRYTTKKDCIEDNFCKLLKNPSARRMNMICSVRVLQQHFKKSKIHKRKNMLNCSFMNHCIIACVGLLLILNQMYLSFHHKFQCPNSSKIITIQWLMVKHLLLFRFDVISQDNNKCSGKETFFYYFNPFTYVCMAGEGIWNSLRGAKLWKSMSK